MIINSNYDDPVCYWCLGYHPCQCDELEREEMNFLIDPKNIINYNRTDAELELFWLFCGCVAGKTASTQARLLDNFLNNLDPADNDLPFARIRKAKGQGTLLQKLQESRLGQYNRLHKMFEGSLDLKLRTCTIEDLEDIPGCGPKTARMFVMQSRPDQKVAALDTHVLKHLRANGIDAPESTPSSGREYRRLEREFLILAEASGMSVADYDLTVWKQYAKI